MIKDFMYEKHMIEMYLSLEALNKQWMEEDPKYKPEDRYMFKSGGDKATEFWCKKHQEELRHKNLDIYNLKNEVETFKKKFKLAMEALQIIKDKAIAADERSGEDKGLYVHIIEETNYRIMKTI